MIMKKIVYLAIATIALIGCAKVVTTTSNDTQRTVFDAWVWKYHPESYNEGHLGGYILKDTELTSGGKAAGDKAYVFAYCTVRDLDGNILSTNEPDIMKQIGTFSASDYQGPYVWKNDSTNIYKSLRDIFRPGEQIVVGPNAKSEVLRLGVRREAAVPGYLQSANVYSTLEQYFNTVTDGVSSQYAITLCDATDDITAWQIDTMERCNIYKRLAHVDRTDSTSYGFYYKAIDFDPVDTVAFSSDTTVNVYYVGRLLNGYVFDTNIADTAKVHNLYKAGSTYSPMKIKYVEDWEKIGTSSNSSETSDLIAGFRKIVYQMAQRRVNSAVGMFLSNFAYKDNSSTGKYPAYSPMIFELTIDPTASSN